MFVTKKRFNALAEKLERLEARHAQLVEVTDARFSGAAHGQLGGLNQRVKDIEDGLRLVREGARVSSPPQSIVDLLDGKWAETHSVPIADVVRRLMKVCRLEIRSTEAKTEVVEMPTPIVPTTLADYAKSVPVPKPKATKKGARRG